MMDTAPAHEHLSIEQLTHNMEHNHTATGQTINTSVPELARPPARIWALIHAFIVAVKVWVGTYLHPRDRDE